MIKDILNSLKLSIPLVVLGGAVMAGAAWTPPPAGSLGATNTPEPFYTDASLDIRDNKFILGDGPEGAGITSVLGKTVASDISATGRVDINGILAVQGDLIANNGLDVGDQANPIALEPATDVVISGDFFLRKDAPSLGLSRYVLTAIDSSGRAGWEELSPTTIPVDYTASGVVEKETSAPSASSGQVVLSCPSGEVAIGGAVACGTSGGQRLKSSYPYIVGDTPRGWVGECNGDIDQMYALCVSL